MFYKCPICIHFKEFFAIIYSNSDCFMSRIGLGDI